MPHATPGRTAQPRPLHVLIIVLALAFGACGPTDGVPSRPTPVQATGVPATGVPATGVPVSPSPDDSAFDPLAVSVRADATERVPGRPLAFAPLPDGRMFVASQDGRAWLLGQGGIERRPLVDLRDQVLSGGERGLLGIAAHPRFADDRRVFVHYTDRDGNTVVSSLESNSEGTRLDAGSERILLRVEQPYGNHNGGGVVFGPDGYLYVSLGDGGSGGDPHGNGQSLDTLLGKILRLDVDGSGGEGYGIPADNPFAGGGGRPEIWLYGLRNPWRITFDRATGDLWIGDVGQSAWEEVNVARAGQAGLNFGWNVLEGRHCFRAETCPTDGLVMPASEYDHSLGCAVIGGYVYRGSAFAELRGAYLFADYCSGRIWAIDAAAEGFQEPIEIGRAGGGLAAFGEDVAGELYLANPDGTVSRITAQPR